MQLPGANRTAETPSISPVWSSGGGPGGTAGDGEQILVLSHPEIETRNPETEALNLIGKEFQFKNLLAMKFTAQTLYHY